MKFYCVILGMLIFAGCFFSFNVYSAALGDNEGFYIDPAYDVSQRKEISATLRQISNQLYFYIDDDWWGKLFFVDQEKVNIALSDLANEFERNIYPILILNFGSEWKPGIDNDDHITVLIHPMKKSRGGYFSSGNEYQKFLVPTSNEREMVYLNSDYIADSINKSFLAHEFMHLITFNQKERIMGIEEETWLNEARAEYVSTLLGYDLEYQGSNLQKRVNEFLQNPSDSITDWQNSLVDYGVLNIFTQYLVERYQIKILTDSLHSSKKGIESINYALAQNGFKEDFSQIFTDWTIAVFINDCQVSEKYCYKNENLKNLKVVPVYNFLPINLVSNLSINYIVKNWTVSWNKIFGGGGTLTFDFDGDPNGNFEVPYVICDNSNICSIKFLILDQNQHGKIVLSEFNTKVISLIIIPSVQSKVGSSFFFTLKASVDFKNQETDLINQLLFQIQSLKAEIAKVQAQIDTILGKSPTKNWWGTCQKFTNDLYFGMTYSQDVRCLQEFLKNQGTEIYPDGLITGNFLDLTKAAVIRFQEKYASEILKPLGIERGTGFVGSATRAKINQLIGS